MNTTQAVASLAGAIGFAGRGLLEPGAVDALIAWVETPHRQALIITSPGEKMIATIVDRIRGSEIGDSLRDRMGERMAVNASDVAWLQDELDTNTPMC